MDKNYIINGNKCEIHIDMNLFNNDAVIATTYRYTGDYFVECSTENHLICVILTSKNNKPISELIPQQFQNDLTDQQVRYNLNKQFGHLRNKIIEEAFAPIN